MHRAGRAVGIGAARRHRHRAGERQDHVADIGSQFGQAITPRERIVVEWYLRGRTLKEIGTLLGKSPRTVEWQWNSVRIKLGVPGTAIAYELVRRRMIQVEPDGAIVWLV
jgi:DNA-binding CsgD family transcriptional regulator